MSVEHAAPGRLMEFMETNELNWDALYAHQAPRIYNYFRFRLGSECDVEELTARTFERAWRSRSRYRRDLAGFSTWLFSIAQNIGTDHLRARREHLPIDAALEVRAEGSPDQDAERRSDLARLALLCGGLPERERELVALKYGALINNRLIAELTGLSESNVGTILHRVVQTLRERW
ncbi:MAG TPA: sigma-70 family RNA polymerase sigma factor [Steroidobacteraceae bacterium]